MTDKNKLVGGITSERPMIYDCAVVGAGPAGSTCARELAKKGCSVLLLERAEFPRDKPCGGGFSVALFDEFPCLKQHEEEILEEICKVGVIHSPNRRITLRGRVGMAVTNRSVFDDILAHEAIRAGAKPAFGVRAKAVETKNGQVRIRTSSDETIICRSVVGADGVNSTVAREMGIHKRWAKNAITPCRVAEMPMEKEAVDRVYGDEREYHFYANLEGRPGYAWIFPKRTTVNVGLGIVASDASGLADHFGRFVRFLVGQGMLSRDYDLSSAKGALVPTGGTLDKTYTDKCILVGDAAGFVNPITGGGISHAMHGATYAAHVIAKALETDNLSASMLAEYQKLWWKKFGRSLNQMVLAQRIFTSPYADLLFEIGRRDRTIQEMVTSSMAESGDSGPDAKRLLSRTIWVCLREALGFGL